VFAIFGGGLVEITDLSGEMVLSWNWSRIGVVRVSCCFWSFLVLGTGDVGSPRGVVVFFLIGDVDIGFFFLKWEEIEGELCLLRVGRALMVLCFPCCLPDWRTPLEADDCWLEELLLSMVG
jgi:hypothetical protein